MIPKLSVNINKVALIRNARGGNLPDLRQFAIDCESFGAQGITVHPRPDERHVRFSDLPIIKELVTTEFNIEGYPSTYFLDKVLEIRPDQCTLVPDPPDVLTSDTGWDFWNKIAFLKPIIRQLQNEGIRVSTFCNPKEKDVEGASEVGADRVEFYTGAYAEGYNLDKEKAIKPHILSARRAEELGLGVNAGHDLNLENLQYYAMNIEQLAEVSIGHALICDALYLGIENVIKMYRQRLVVR